MTPNAARDAVARLESAVRLDPNYARAYAALSHAYWYLGSGLDLLSRDESTPAPAKRLTVRFGSTLTCPARARLLPS